MRISVIYLNNQKAIKIWKQINDQNIQITKITRVSVSVYRYNLSIKIINIAHI